MNKYSKLFLGTLFLLALAACNEEEQAGKHADHEQVKTHEQEHNHSENEHTRFIVTSNSAVHVLNEDFEEMSKFELANASASQIGDSPYVFVKDMEKNSTYQFLHSGTWVEEHGDHTHPYTEDAALFESKLQGSKPAHVVSHENQVAIFNDGDGSVQVYNINEKAIDAAPTLAYEFKEGIMHHGVAIPLADNKLAVSYPAKEGDALPAGVKIVNEQGQEQYEITNSCEQLHGAAYTNSTLAFGCVGEVVLYDVEGKETRKIKLDDEKSRVGTFKFAKDSQYLLSNYSFGKEPSKKLGIINTKTAEMSYITLPAAYKTALLATKDKGYVLAEDGYIYVIDFAKKAISTKVHALNEFDLETEAPTLHDVNGEIYVVMPGYEKVYAVHGNHADEVTKLPFVPTSFIVK